MFSINIIIFEINLVLAINYQELFYDVKFIKSLYYIIENYIFEMSQSLGLKKSLLKFKPSAGTKSITKSSNIKIQQTKAQQEIEEKQQVCLKNEHASQITNKLPQDYKTQAQRAYELVKKHRIIHKMSDKAKTSNKQRIERMNKMLSKLPDHFDLSKTGQKIQKGY